jgi:hypothetical protein
MSSRDDLDAERSKKIEHMLMYLGLHTRSFGCPDPMYFDNALPAYSSMLAPIIADAGSNNREIDATAAALPRIDGNVMFGSEDEGEFTLIGCHPMSFYERKRFVSAGGGLFKPPPGVEGEDARSVLTPLTPILQIRKVVVGTDGRGIPHSPAYMARLASRKNKWVQLIGGELIGDMSLAYLGFGMAVGISAAAATRWSISLRFEPESPGLCFITDPTGIREFFRFRDVPEGKARRSALVGWVTDHWRVSRKDPNDEIYVREHLRGVREFSWRSLAGSIHIPELDVKKDAAAKEKRKRMPAHEALRRRRLK